LEDIQCKRVRIEDLVRAKVRIDKILVESWVAGGSLAETFSDDSGKDSVKRDCRSWRIGPSHVHVRFPVFNRTPDNARLYLGIRDLAREVTIFRARWLNYRWIYCKARQLAVTAERVSDRQNGRRGHVQRTPVTYVLSRLYDTIFVHRINCINMGDGEIFIRKGTVSDLSRVQARGGDYPQ
jgi:hypothetical protein